MDLMTSIFGVVVAMVGGLALNILANDLYDRCPRVARWLIDRAVARLPSDTQDRFYEEWTAHLLDCPTKLDQVRHALGVWWAAGQIGSRSREDSNLKWYLYLDKRSTA